MTGVSTLGQALSQIKNIKDQQTIFSLLSTQLATGKKTQEFSGLGTRVLESKRARADFQSLDVYISNIKSAQTRISLMTDAIEEFKEQASNFYDYIIGFSQESIHQLGEVVYEDDPLTTEVEQVPVGMTSAQGDVDFESLKSFAESVFGFMGDLLNVKYGDRLLLGGSETFEQPYTDSGTLDAAMTTLLTDWKGGAIGNTELIADLTDREASASNPNAINDSTIGYTAALSSGNAGKVFVRVNEVSEINFTALANEQPFRDIMAALAYFKNENLGPIADTYIPPNGPPNPPDVQGAPGNTLDQMKDNFFGVFNEMAQTITEALRNIDQVSFRLEDARARLAHIEENHKQQKNLLLSTVSDVEDVDLNEVAIKVNILQVQLEASYQVTARLQELSLAQFLPF